MHMFEYYERKKTRKHLIVWLQFEFVNATSNIFSKHISKKFSWTIIHFLGMCMTWYELEHKTHCSSLHKGCVSIYKQVRKNTFAICHQWAHVFMICLFHPRFVLVQFVRFFRKPILKIYTTFKHFKVRVNMILICVKACYHCKPMLSHNFHLLNQFSNAKAILPVLVN